MHSLLPTPTPRPVARATGAHAIFAAAIVITVISGCAGPAWYRGNLHTHSLWSDGDGFPEMISSWYKARGYDFLAISDHNVLSRGERWILHSEVVKRGGKNALEEYIEAFGDDWVETRGEGVELEIRLRGLEEYRPELEEPGSFLLIEGEEISDSFEKLPIHLNATNLAELIAPRGGTSVADTIRRNVEAVEEQARALDRPILVHLNHPNFGWAVTAEELAEVTNERFFEVYNGHPSVANRGDALHAGTEAVWDIANTIRLARLDAPPLFGLAVDDSHDYHDTEGSIPGRGWIVVRARALEADALIEAMERGDFYASSGVSLRDVSWSESTGLLTIEIDPAVGAEYTTYFIGTRVEHDGASEPVVDADGKEVHASHRYSQDIGVVFAAVEGTRASYRLVGDELYVRAVVVSSLAPERPLHADQMRKAWTQPVGWRRHLATSTRSSDDT